MSTSSKIGKEYLKSDILSAMADVIEQKYIRGEMGLEGRSPIHVQESVPTSADVELGDLWFKPSTKQVFVNTGSVFEEIAKQGEMGLEGEKGEKGDKGDKGEKGEKGKDGKDADISELYTVAEVKAESAISDHEKKYDHSQIDPFLLGSKKVSEAGMEDGMMLSYDKKGDRLIYTTVKQVASKVSKIGRGGVTLPSQSGNAGKVLTTDGSHTSWTTPATGGDVATDAIWDTKGDLAVGTGANTASKLTVGANGYVLVADSAEPTGLKWSAAASGSGITRDIASISSPTTLGATSLTDYVRFVSGTTTVTLPTAVGNSNKYTIKNTGVNTVTIATTSSQTIDGSTTITLPVQNTSIDLISDNSNWRIV